MLDCLFSSRSRRICNALDGTLPRGERSVGGEKRGRQSFRSSRGGAFNGRHSARRDPATGCAPPRWWFGRAARPRWGLRRWTAPATQEAAQAPKTHRQSQEEEQTPASSRRLQRRVTRGNVFRKMRDGREQLRQERQLRLLRLRSPLPGLLGVQRRFPGMCARFGSSRPCLRGWAGLPGQRRLRL